MVSEGLVGVGGWRPQRSLERADHESRKRERGKVRLGRGHLPQDAEDPSPGAPVDLPQAVNEPPAEGIGAASGRQRRNDAMPTLIRSRVTGYW